MAPELASRGASLTHISLTIFMSYCICVLHDVALRVSLLLDNAFIKYSNTTFYTCNNNIDTIDGQLQTVEKSNFIPEKYHKIRQNCVQRLPRKRKRQREWRKLITVITLFRARGKIDFYIISFRRFIGLTCAPNKAPSKAVEVTAKALCDCTWVTGERGDQGGYRPKGWPHLPPLSSLPVD